jgi:hypothetical protein
LQHSLKNIENRLKASQEHKEGSIANGAVATTLSHQKQSLEHKLTCNDEEHQPVTLTNESSHSLISNISSHHSEQVRLANNSIVLLISIVLLRVKLRRY